MAFRISTPWLIGLLAVATMVLVNVAAAATDDDTNIVEDTMRLLKAGESVLELREDIRDVTLLLGKTGTGKSTLTLFLTANLTDLTSEKKGSVHVINYKHDGYIGNSSTTSQTIYPALHIDEYNLPYYDCPGWDDTRNTSIEIAATYFVKRVIEHAKSVKILLVVNGHSVTPSQSKTELGSMVEDAQAFLKDFERYKDSIAMVVTKVQFVVDFAGVPAIPSMPGFLISPDNVMIQNIATFLSDYKKELLTNTDEKSRRSVQLMDILTTTPDNGETFPKIAIFRSPLMPGPLSENQWFIDERAALRQAIINNTVYTPRRSEDFGFTLSSKSKLRILGMVEHINSMIVKQLEKLSTTIEQQINEVVDKQEDIAEISDYFEKTAKHFASFENASAISTLPAFIERISQACVASQIDVPSNFWTELDKQERYLTFLQEMSDKPVKLNPLAWTEGISRAVRSVRANGQFFQFLTQLKKNYAKYDFRVDVEKYNVADLADWGKSGRPQGISIDANNFTAFVRLQENAGILPDGFQPNESHLRFLNKLLVTMLQSKPTFECAPDTLRVKGEFVRLSEIDLKQCDKSTNDVHIYALDTVYIDQDLGKFDLPWKISIIAPRWYVFGRQVLINLNGTDGRHAYDVHSGYSDDHGYPGETGTNAGQFYGIGLTFENAKNLVVHGKFVVHSKNFLHPSISNKNKYFVQHNFF